MASSPVALYDNGIHETAKRCDGEATRMVDLRKQMPRIWAAFSDQSRTARPQRRARLHLECLDARLVPSALTPPRLVGDVGSVSSIAPVNGPSRLAQFNGIYNITYTAQITTPLGAQTKSGSFNIKITNGAITFGGHKVGTVTPNGSINLHGTFQGATAQIHGRLKIAHGNATGNGTFSGKYLGFGGNGTFHAIRTLSVTQLPPQVIFRVPPD